MKKLFLLATAGIFFTAGLKAQVARNADPSQSVSSDSLHHQRGELMRQLNLSPDQKAQIKSLHQSNKQEREAILNDETLTQLQKKIKMKELRKSQSEKLNSILTPDQQAQRNAYIQQIRAERKMEERNNPDDNRPVNSNQAQ